jgi:hypothetical protein
MSSQGLLFSEPSVAETGVWCTLSEEIDPAEWAGVCRQIGQFSLLKFQMLRQLLRSSKGTEAIQMPDPSRKPYVQPPLVSIGPSGIGGEYQREMG